MTEITHAARRFSDRDLDALRARATAAAVARLHGITLQREGQVLRALCPLHVEKTPSFTVFPDGRAHCFGCGWQGDGLGLHQALTKSDFITTVRDLAAQLGVGLANPHPPLRPPPPEPDPPDLPLTRLDGPHRPCNRAWPLVDTGERYAYTDAEGRLVCYEARVFLGRGKHRKKRSVPCRPSPFGLIRGTKEGVYFQDPRSTAGQPAWAPWRGARTPKDAPLMRFPGVTVPLFNLPSLLAEPFAVVFLAEGPKDATTVDKLGLLGTTFMFGAGAAARAEPAVLQPLAGREVALLRDGDEAGERGVEAAAAALHAAGARVRLLPAFTRPAGERPQGDRQGGKQGDKQGDEQGDKFDVSDWAAAARRAGRRNVELAQELLERYRTAPPYRPPPPQNGAGGHHNGGRPPGTASPPPPGDDDDRPCVLLSPQENIVNDAVLRALAARAGDLYDRSGTLVEIVPPRHEGPAPRGPRAAPVLPPRLRELTTAHVRFCRPGRPLKNRPPRILAAHPPDWCIKALSARSDWPGLRTLNGIVQGPVIRRDGSVLEQPGYDPATGLLYLPRGKTRFEPVPEAPTARQTEEALVALLETVCDFPFEDEAHQAAWLAALLTVVARPAIDCPVPLFLADATAPGAGKGMVLHTISLLATGRPAPLAEWPSEPEEQRKTISSFLVEGTQMVVFDNVVRTLGGATLDMLLTSDRITGRVLGTTRTFDLPNNATWMATANNCDLGGDTARRTIQIRLSPDVERPELRNDFRHRDLRGWIVNNRYRLLPAALTLLRGYWLEVRPHERPLEDLLAAQAEAGLEAFGMSEAWSVRIRGCVTWLGLPDPATTRESLRTQSSQELADLRDLIQALAAYLAEANESATTTKNLCANLRATGKEGSFSLLRTVLVDALYLRPGQQPTPRRVGKLFSRHKGRIIDGKAIQLVGISNKASLWTVEEVKKGI